MGLSSPCSAAATARQPRHSDALLEHRLPQRTQRPVLGLRPGRLMSEILNQFVHVVNYATCKSTPSGIRQTRGYAAFMQTRHSCALVLSFVLWLTACGTLPAMPDAPGACAPCGSNADCAPGYTCRTRACDGLRACHAGRVDCAQISDFRCPATTVYETCETDAACGPLAQCRPVEAGASVCRPGCLQDQQCPVSATADLIPRCDQRQALCYLQCIQGLSQCPAGQQCIASGGQSVCR